MHGSLIPVAIVAVYGLWAINGIWGGVRDHRIYARRWFRIRGQVALLYVTATGVAVTGFITHDIAVALGAAVAAWILRLGIGYCVGKFIYHFDRAWVQSAGANPLQGNATAARIVRGRRDAD